MATQADLDALDTAIKTGAIEVRFQDRVVRYNTTDQVLRARTLVYLELHPRVGSGNPVRQIRLNTSKGM